jgi:hypothetical protein
VLDWNEPRRVYRSLGAAPQTTDHLALAAGL